jgi:K+-transporting ATPase ATPase C chain
MKTGKMFWISFKLILVSIILFGFVYPFLVGGIGQIWHHKSNGSLIQVQGESVGSKLIGQNFNSQKYFHSRPSSINYDARQSGSANLAPNNPELKNRVENQIQLLDQEYLTKSIIPADMVTESGSALDPHISPESAFFQVDRIAAATGLEKEIITNIIEKQIDDRFLGVFGEKRVNVLELNIKLEEVLN